MENVEILNGLSNIITSVGFPIVWSFVLFWYVNEQKRAHVDEVKGLTEVIAENNTILASLKQLIEDKLK